MATHPPYRPLPPPALHAGPVHFRQAVTDIDWHHWVRVIERKRRLYVQARARQRALPTWFVTEATRTSFGLEKIELSNYDLGNTLAPHESRPPLRSRQRQRARNHMALVQTLDRRVRRREMIKADQVLRWYTSISSGLSTTMPAEPKLLRIESVVRRINSPQLRVQPAVTEIAQLYTEVSADHLVPSFSGILARLLLQVHLGHCGLAPVLLDPAVDARHPGETALTPARLLELIEQSFDRLTT